MKGARVLFTEEYNCQKNKRSQSLFARTSLTPSVSFSLPPFSHFHPPTHTVAWNLFSLLFLCATPSAFSSPRLSLSLFFDLLVPPQRSPLVTFQPLSNPLPPLLQPTSLYCDLVEKLTRLAGQRIRNYDLSRRRDYLLSRRLWNPGRYSSLQPLRAPASFATLFFPLRLLCVLSSSLSFLFSFLHHAPLFFSIFTRSPSTDADLLLLTSPRLSLDC